MSLPVLAFAAMLALPVAGDAPAAPQHLAGGTKTSAEAQVADLADMRAKFVALARAFPAESYDWRPMEGVRSVRDVLALIALEGTLFPTLWGYDPPDWVADPTIGAELARLRLLPFDELVTAVDRSFGHTLGLIDGMDAHARTRSVGFFGLEVPLGTAVTLMANDMHEHLGQLIAYARTLRVVPPWNRSARLEEGGTPPHPRPGDIFVANLQTSDVAWYDGRTGGFVATLVQPGAGGLDGATGLAFGPDGDLYVSSSRNHRILRFDGTTGEPAGVFAAGRELRTPFSIAFGPGGDVYVSSGTEHRVLRYEGRTGTLLGVAAQDDRLRQPIGLAFGPDDGLLYVVNSAGRNVMRFDPVTGESLGVFATDSLRFPSDLAFGADGDLYVTSAASSAVVRFHGTTGEFVEIRARLPGDGGVPVGIAALPDGALVIGDFGRGRLYSVDPGQATPRLLSSRGLARPENVAVRPRILPPPGGVDQPSDQEPEGRPIRRILEQDSTLNNLVAPPGSATAELGTLGDVVRVGRGPEPVVLVPGLGFGADVFDSFMTGREEEFSMYAVTLPGFAGTPAPPTPPPGTRFEEQTWTNAAVAAVEGLMRDEGLNDVIVVGHWLTGTQIALRIAIERPERVRAVVLLAGSARYVTPEPDPDIPDTRPLEQRGASVDTLADRWFRTVTRETWDDNNFLPGDYAAHPVLGLRLWREAARPPLHVWVRYLLEFLAQDITLALDGLRVPTLLLRPGLEGAYHPPGNNYLFAYLHRGWPHRVEAHPYLESRTVPWTRVVMWADRPAAVDAAVQTFLDRLPREPAPISTTRRMRTPVVRRFPSRTPRRRGRPASAA